MNHSKVLLLVLLCFICKVFEVCDAATYPNDPDTNPPSQWSSMSNNFQQHCSPFGVSIFARNWPRDKFLHACNVMAQMLDNDQDGCADDTDVVKNIRANQAGMAMFPTSNINSNIVSDTFHFQDLYATETELGCSGASETSNCRDAAIEEILHVITSQGLGPAYPSDFSECSSDINNLSTMQVQMDIARGGHFTSIPSTYPSEAIYHYDDRTCDYRCMTTEFIYWALTSLLNGQDARTDEISIEWEANTPAKLQSMLPDMYTLLIQNPSSMKLFSSEGVLPGSRSSTGATGTYKPSSQTCSSGCGLDGSGCGSQGNSEDFDACNSAPTPTAPTPTLPTPTPPSGGGELNGEEACENKGYTEEECPNVGDGSCCEFDDGECWSKISTDICPGTGGAPTPPTAPTPTPPSPTSGSCNDSSLRFRVQIDGKNKMRDCKWVSTRPNRCRSFDGVATHCRVTCRLCSTCEDAELKFKVLLKGKLRAKDCKWVGTRGVRSRCKLSGVKDTCPDTCEVCSSRKSIFS